MYRDEPPSPGHDTKFVYSYTSRDAFSVVGTCTGGQAYWRLARYAATVPAALVLGVTKVVGAALHQTRSVQRGDGIAKVADRTLARLGPPLGQATAVTLWTRRAKKRKKKN